MKKVLPFISLLVVLLAGVYVFFLDTPSDNNKQSTIEINTFYPTKPCFRLPKFLTKHGIHKNVMIDLSQQKAKGVSFRFGHKFQKILHAKEWEKYDYFGTYTLDKDGNVYLVPMPFISIHDKTFEYQKHIYKLDTSSGKLSIYMSFDDVKASNLNPYGLTSIVYDCKSDRFYISAIDESTYDKAYGVIYVVDKKTKKILQKIEGFDALSLAILEDDTHHRYLLAGSAKDSALYAYNITSSGLNDKSVKLLELPNATQHIRKIRIKSKNMIKLQAIEFSYSLVASSDSMSRYRYHYSFRYDPKIKKFILEKRSK